jgi:ABC-type transport system substrate-binding protein
MDNGDTYSGDNYDYKEAKKKLKEAGYNIAYSGRKINKYGIKVLVGINGKNNVPLWERRENGLYRATKIIL